MPYGDPPPWPWNDAIGYLPWWMITPPGVEAVCVYCERPIAECKGLLFSCALGPERSPLWFWEP